MGYRPKHARPIRRFRILLAGTGLATTLIAMAVLGTAPALAQTVTVPITNITASPVNGGEAGYYAVDNGSTRFRFITATVTAGLPLVDLNGNSAANLGAVGVELCDPNTGEAFQLGVTSPAPGVYQVVYGYGVLTGTYEDYCIQSGILLPIPSGGFLTASPASDIGVIAGQATSEPIATGDSLMLSIYYNPKKHSSVEFTVCDASQSWGCRNPTIGHVGYQNFYEFGVGGLTTSVSLTSPALNELSLFSNTAANYYSSKTSFNSIYVPAHWNLREGVLVNASSQPIMSPDASLGDSGSEFTLDEGSTSP